MINNILSETKDMICGVQKGSFLDPLSFIIYFNDIFALLKITKSMLLVDNAPI